ncbi:MAG: DUF695 domain-containing protein [Oceanospirillaceae bacterium]|nr:DUF695 domain-containing protein [Oceanospirillaceae bacterium]MCP5335304.1 DUF695 domain-containing protein [Oceanospirillaceae bacterium]MCP5350743.1 DUF695 domain-containing protein [Oceanospirillaceae bacterium]
MSYSNHWVLADGTLNNSPITIRYRDQVSAEQTSGQYPYCVQIAWNADEVDPASGYPAMDEMERIDLFNKALMMALEEKQNGLLTMVLTSQGVNQWVIYARSIERVKEALDSIPTEKGLYPIEVVADEDAPWATYTELTAAIMKV